LPNAPPTGGANWMSPVRSQGGCGSCWAFSSVGVVEGTYNIEQGNPNLNPDMSEQYLITNCFMGGDCSGGWHHEALRHILYSGITDENCFPYQDASGCPMSCSGCDEIPTVCSNVLCSDRCSDWNTRLWTIDSFMYAGRGYAMKNTLISKGPLSVIIGSWNHAVVVVGYSDPGGYWIFKNSWGTGWGSGGYDTIPYSDVIEGYYVEGVNPP